MPYESYEQESKLLVSPFISTTIWSLHYSSYAESLDLGTLEATYGSFPQNRGTILGPHTEDHLRWVYIVVPLISGNYHMVRKSHGVRLSLVRIYNRALPCFTLGKEAVVLRDSLQKMGLNNLRLPALFGTGEGE